MRADIISVLFLLLASPSAASEDNCATDDVSLLQHNSNNADAWDLKGAMADLPGGAYFKVMDPVMEAVSFSYKASEGPDHDPEYAAMRSLRTQFFGSDSWNRVSELELNPEGPGAHAFTFADSLSDKMIIAFRGSCKSNGGGSERELLINEAGSTRQCQADMCFLLKHQAFGEASKDAFGSEEYNSCDSFTAKELDYLSQAKQLVATAQKTFPQRQILLTGHSLGGMLATVTAARQPAKLVALTFAPMAWSNALTDLDEEAVARLESSAPGRRVAVCDPYDCAINSMAVGSARSGAITCLYNDEENIEPVHCQGIAQRVSGGKLDAKDMSSVMACRNSVHRWGRYLGFVRMTSADGRPLVTPKCREAFSHNSEELRRALIRQYRD